MLINTDQATPSLQAVRNTLSSSYQMLVESDWPPFKPSKFIKLTLSLGEKTYRNTVERTIDDISAKENIIYSSQLVSLLEDDLQNKSKFGMYNCQLYLLSGRPGCGKTTLTNILSREWANGRLFPSRLLFVISLRRFKSQESSTLTTVIQQSSPALAQCDLRELIAFVQLDNGKNVVFVFDGLDEYAVQNRDDDIVFKLIKGRLLPNAIVIVASRPAACTELREDATREIEVLGFFQEQIKDYMKGQFKDAKAQELINHLEEHPNLMNMCYLPLHCAMFAYLFNGNSVLPKTETEFYEHYTISTLLRAIKKRRGRVISLSDYDQLSDDDKSLFRKVCELAFDGAVAIEPKHVFTRDEMPESAFGEDSDRTGNDESTLGLMVIDRYFMKNGIDETYTFLHRTHQEYLAAVHIAQLSEEDRQKLVNDHGGKKHLSVVWRFLCGMLNYSEPTAMPTLKTLITEQKDLLSKIQYAHESQHPGPCNYVLRSLERRNLIMFEVGNVTFNPSDFIALGYVVTRAESNTGENQRKIFLIFNQCKLSVTGAAVLLRHIGKHPFILEISK